MLFPFRNVRDVIGLHAKVSSHKKAVIFYDAQQVRYEMSYLEFVGKSHQVANFLYEDLGINRGDTIAIASSNQENSLLLYFATWVIGAAVVSIDTSQNDEAIHETLRDSKAQVLFAEHRLLDKYAALAKSLNSIEGVIQIGGDEREDYMRFEDLAANRPTTFLGDESGAKGADIPMTGGNQRTARLSDMALIHYKNGVAIHQTQGDLLHNANRLAQATALTGNQTLLATLPFYNNFALSIMAPLIVGATLVLQNYFSSDTFWQAIVKERVHTTILDSNGIQQLVERARNYVEEGKVRFGGKIIQQDVKHFRHILISDTSLTRQLACDFEDTFGIPLITAYQDPKTDELLTLLPITLSWHHHQSCLHGHDTVSIGSALTEIAVLDENGLVLPENQSGQIALKHGDSWKFTGDMGYFIADDDNQRFYFLA